MFDLPAVLDLLAEHAVLVAQAVADRRDLQRRQRVEKTGGQPAQPAVAQPRVGLLLEQRLPVLAGVRSEVVADELLDLKVGDVVRQRPADQELHRKVVDLLGFWLSCVRSVKSQRWVSRSRIERAIASNRSRALAFSSGIDMVEDQVPIVVVVIGEAERATLDSVRGVLRVLAMQTAPGIRSDHSLECSLKASRGGRRSRGG